jgi:hypothetical protein
MSRYNNKVRYYEDNLSKFYINEAASVYIPMIEIEKVISKANVEYYENFYESCERF